MTPPRLVFVYNADAGLAAGLLDLVHKTLSPSTYPCSLCGVTYGPLGMKTQWRDWLKSLPYESVFFHRPDFRTAYPAFADRPLPLIGRDGDDGLIELLGAAQLARLTTLDALIAALRERLEA